MKDRLSLASQENLLTVLAHSDQYGKIVAESVEPKLFEGDYSVIAERCIAYWRENNVAPKVHTHDLFADIIEAKDNRRASTFRSILNEMVRLSEEINGDYVIRELSKFRRLQLLKEAIIDSAERLTKPTENTIEEVEEILANILRARDYQLDTGMRLSDLDRLFKYLETQTSEFVTGVPEFDKFGIGPHRGEVFLLLGGKGRGKSWGLINLGKRALLKRQKVLHITLEMNEEQVSQRYLQSLFAISKREARVKQTVLEFDKENKFVGIDEDEVDVGFTFSSPDAREELETHLQMFGMRKIENLIVKRFPTRGLTMNALGAYMDGLREIEGFIPDITILDYIGITKTDPKNFRLSLIQNIEDFRAIMIERDCAGATAHQLSREGFDAQQATSTDTAEAWGLIHAADTTVTHSATREEQKRGLGRLFVDHARGERDKFGVLITQNYEIGQFILQSVLLPDDYFSYLDTLKSTEAGMDKEEED